MAVLTRRFWGVKKWQFWQSWYLGSVTVSKWSLVNLSEPVWCTRCTLQYRTPLWCTVWWYPVVWVLGHGADPTRYPWYGSGCTVSLVLRHFPCFRALWRILTILTDFDHFDGFWPYRTHFGHIRHISAISDTFRLSPVQWVLSPVQWVLSPVQWCQQWCQQWCH